MEYWFTEVTSRGSPMRNNLTFWCLKHGVSQEEILSCSKEQKVKDLVSAIAGEAKAHLEKVRGLFH